MRVVVTGAAGQLGQVVVALFNARHDVVALTRSDVDLTNHDAVVGSIGAARPDVVINCSAYNAVDQAEDDASTALAVNAHAVRSLARFCSCRAFIRTSLCVRVNRSKSESPLAAWLEYKWPGRGRFYDCKETRRDISRVCLLSLD